MLEESDSDEEKKLEMKFDDEEAGNHQALDLEEEDEF